MDELICSQEEPGSHTHPQTTADDLNVSYSSVQRMVKRSKINQFKRVQTPQMDDGARERRVNRASGLAQKFGKNPRMVERAVFQDESDFPLQIPINKQNNRIYFRGKKSDVPEENLCHQGNRQTKKVMVSAALTWHGVTKPFFVNCRGVKVNGQIYKKNFFLRSEKCTLEMIGFLSKTELHLIVQTLSKTFYEKRCTDVTSARKIGH